MLDPVAANNPACSNSRLFIHNMKKLMLIAGIGLIAMFNVQAVRLACYFMASLSADLYQMYAFSISLWFVTPIIAGIMTVSVFSFLFKDKGAPNEQSKSRIFFGSVLAPICLISVMLITVHGISLLACLFIPTLRLTLWDTAIALLTDFGLCIFTIGLISFVMCISGNALTFIPSLTVMLVFFSTALSLLNKFICTVFRVLPYPDTLFTFPAKMIEFIVQQFPFSVLMSPLLIALFLDEHSEDTLAYINTGSIGLVILMWGIIFIILAFVALLTRPNNLNGKQKLSIFGKVVLGTILVLPSVLYSFYEIRNYKSFRWDAHYVPLIICTALYILICFLWTKKFRSFLKVLPTVVLPFLLSFILVLSCYGVGHIVNSTLPKENNVDRIVVYTYYLTGDLFPDRKNFQVEFDSAENIVYFTDALERSTDRPYTSENYHRSYTVKFIYNNGYTVTRRMWFDKETYSTVVEIIASHPDTPSYEEYKETHGSK